jgi:hypothetical protein
MADSKSKNKNLQQAKKKQKGRVLYATHRYRKGTQTLQTPLCGQSSLLQL